MTQDRIYYEDLKETVEAQVDGFIVGLAQTFRAYELGLDEISEVTGDVVNTILETFDTETIKRKLEELKDSE